ncbi:MAG: hypothetical protein E7620_07615 [Ruminococcaceae bacterium]|nr:hypothetical protein [Oscillospiraceae bacterium]
MKHNFKKTVSLFLAAMMLLTVAVIGVSAEDAATTETPKYTQNTGWGDTDGDNVFEVGTPEDLLALAAKRPANGSYAGKTIKLTADIDMNPGWDASSGIEPVNVWATMFRFDGILDGQGHVIRGLYSKGDANGSNASFITNLVGAKIMNLRIENSWFTAAKNNAGFVSCVKNDSSLENVYVNAIVESKGVCAGGIISWFYTSAAATETPKATLKSCVFDGSVTALNYAGGLIGMSGSYKVNEETGAFFFNKSYEVTMEDCANYGSVSVGTEGLYVGGLIGAAPGVTSLTRCYNAGTMTAFAGAKSALLNVVQDAVAGVVIADCYFKQEEGTSAFTKTEAATSVTMTYEGASATELTALNADQLIEKTAFKTAKWEMNDTKALPAGVADMVREHNYEAVVTPPTCKDRGYTTYTCKDEGCNASYVGDYTETTAHTEGEEWIVDKEPTTEAAGSRHKECTVCGKTVKTEVLKKLEPEVTEAPATEAPATEAPATTTGNTTTEKGGCGATVTAGLAGMVLLFAGAAFSMRKKED